MRCLRAFPPPRLTPLSPLPPPPSPPRRYAFAFAYDEDDDASAASGSTSRLTSDDIKHLLYSISDNNTFTVENVVPVEKMLRLLETNFRADSVPPGTASLAIYAGSNGARLTHSHTSQYAFVRQSLVLWRAILRDFFQCVSAGDSTATLLHLLTPPLLSLPQPPGTG